MLRFCWYWPISVWSWRFQSHKTTLMLDLGPLALRFYG